MYTLSVGECIGYGWETFKRRPWILIGAFLLASIISGLPQAIAPYPMPAEPGLPPPPPSTLSIVMSLVSIVVTFFVSLGLITFFLRAHDNVDAVTIGDLWNPAPFWPFVGAYILVTLTIIAGFVLLIVPGIIASLGLGFAPYLTIDRGMGPVEAYKGSWHITKGNKWQLFLLGLTLLGLNILGALALIVGLLVTTPITLIAIAHAYRVLESRAG